MAEILPLHAFILGFIGSLAPEIIRLYGIRSKPGRFQWSWFYVVVSVLFCCLGGLVALLLPATTYWAAFYAGVSAPVLITKIATRAGGRSPTLKSETSGSRPAHLSIFLDAL